MHQAAPIFDGVGFAFLCRDSAKLEQVQFYSCCSIGCMVFLNKAWAFDPPFLFEEKVSP